MGAVDVAVMGAAAKSGGVDVVARAIAAGGLLVASGSLFWNVRVWRAATLVRMGIDVEEIEGEALVAYTIVNRGPTQVMKEMAWARVNRTDPKTWDLTWGGPLVQEVAGRRLQRGDEASGHAHPPDEVAVGEEWALLIDTEKGRGNSDPIMRMH